MVKQNEYVVTEKMLEIIRAGGTIRVKNDVELSGELLIDFNEMLYRIERSVAAELLADDYYTEEKAFEYPETTWQMFKMTHENSWWLGWLVRRRPVRFHKEWKTFTVQVKRYASYPDAEIPKRGRPVPIEIVNRLS